MRALAAGASSLTGFMENGMAIDPEIVWLRPRVICMRALLRFAKDARVEAALKDLITDAEDRLAALEEQALAGRIIYDRPKRTAQSN
jgi:hypothetical protein